MKRRTPLVGCVVDESFSDPANRLSEVATRHRELAQSLYRIAPFGNRVVSLRDGRIVDEAVLESARSMTAADLIRIPVEETVA